MSGLGAARSLGSADPGTRDTGVSPVVRPPLLYLASILTGVGLGARWPVEPLPAALEWLGVPVMLVALGLFAWAVGAFRRAGTPIPSHRPVAAVVQRGPYRLTRNPIYLAFTLLQLGIAIRANNAWLLALLVPTVALIRWGVIAREERYLTAKFGAEYDRYRQTVRRWL